MLEEKDILAYLNGQKDIDFDQKLKDGGSDIPSADDLDMMKEIWDLADDLKGYETFDADDAWMTFENNLMEDETASVISTSEAVVTENKAIVRSINQRKNSRRWGYVAVAASLALLISAAYFLLLPKDIFVGGNSWAENTILPDGSTVTLLDRASTLTYPSSFKNKEQRIITVTGNATVDVARNEDQPFFVENYETSIAALGTIFKIESERTSIDSSKTELLNIEGVMEMAEMADRSNAQKLSIEGEKAVFETGMKIEFVPAPKPPEPVYVAPDTPGQIITLEFLHDWFNNEYPEKVTSIPGLKYSEGAPVKVDLNQSLENVMNQLDSTMTIRVNKEGDFYTITRFESKK